MPPHPLSAPEHSSHPHSGSQAAALRTRALLTPTSRQPTPVLCFRRRRQPWLPSPRGELPPLSFHSNHLPSTPPSFHLNRSSDWLQSKSEFGTKPPPTLESAHLHDEHLALATFVVVFSQIELLQNEVKHPDLLPCSIIHCSSVKTMPQHCSAATHAADHVPASARRCQPPANDPRVELELLVGEAHVVTTWIATGSLAGASAATTPVSSHSPRRRSSPVGDRRQSIPGS